MSWLHPYVAVWIVVVVVGFVCCTYVGCLFSIDLILAHALVSILYSFTSVMCTSFSGTPFVCEVLQNIEATPKGDALKFAQLRQVNTFSIETTQRVADQDFTIKITGASTSMSIFVIFEIACVETLKQIGRGGCSTKLEKGARGVFDRMNLLPLHLPSTPPSLSILSILTPNFIL